MSNLRCSALLMPRFRRLAAFGSCLLLAVAMLGPVWGQSAASASNSTLLMKEIDNLLVVELTADDDTAAVARVQKIFAEYGILSKEQVGASVFEEFVVLLVNDQTLAFMKSALPAVTAAVAQGKLSENNGRFFRARLQQKTVEDSMGKPTNLPLQTEIETIFKGDQAVRGSDKFEPQKMQDTDQANRAAIHSILERYGMPTFAMVGADAATDFVVLIQHQPADFRQQALPLLEQNVAAGQASARDYAMMYDRAQTDQGKPEMYGVNLLCQPDGTLAPGPLVDPEHVEDRRAAIGLVPLKTYMHMAPVVTPPGFCKPTGSAPKK